LAAMSDTNFVSSLYQGALDRTADSAGQTYWTGIVASSGRGAVALQLANTHEVR
jgi:hypothetical protein